MSSTHSDRDEDSEEEQLEPEPRVFTKLFTTLNKQELFSLAAALKVHVTPTLTVAELRAGLKPILNDNKDIYGNHPSFRALYPRTRARTA